MRLKMLKIACSYYFAWRGNRPIGKINYLKFLGPYIIMHNAPETMKENVHKTEIIVCKLESNIIIYIKILMLTIKMPLKTAKNLQGKILRVSV
jgi:hypothetical protein